MSSCNAGGGPDFDVLQQQLDRKGWAILPSVLSAPECEAIREQYVEDPLYRSTVVMSRHGFGQGEYRYFDYPLPETIKKLRSRFYPPLSKIANDWNETLGKPARFPDTHGDFIKDCRCNGQTRPTPLILKYGTGDYNCLHQDVYGEILFPIQMAILLSEPQEEFTGGEFVLSEQRPRMQSRPHVASLRKGDAIIFAVNEFPRLGKRGAYRVKMRHGVSQINSGHRFTLGIIFHDAA